MELMAISSAWTFILKERLVALTGSIGGWGINADSITGTGVTLSSAGDAYTRFWNHAAD